MRETNGDGSQDSAGRARSRPWLPSAPTGSALAALTAAAVLAGLPGLAACGTSHEPPRAGRTSPDSAARNRPSAKPSSGWDTRPGSIAALGDSITRGFDACSVLADCPQVSWATGTDPQVRSLAQRLLKHPAAGSWNYARSGARMADLPGQVSAAAGHKPELVTVLMGANDACRGSTTLMTPVGEFRADFKEALKRLRRALPRTRVYVASIPDLMRLWSVGRQSPMGREVWKLGVCASMLGSPQGTDRASAQRRKLVYDRVVAYNAALKDVCDRDPLCRFDGAVFAYRFTARQLSRLDWFHPSRNGQERLAELAYRRITAEAPAA